MEWYIADDGRYHVKMSWTTAIDFATYFMRRGIPTEFATDSGGDDRYIHFHANGLGADIMLAWVKRWEKGHEYCPFCGGVPELRVEEVNDPNILLHTVYRIECLVCRAKTGGWFSEEHAWDQWNRRVKGE